ncbi:hypothetical protein HDA32_002707 [Spinactinospora alkalitolerans]|uniref:Uncharacterized protein n=1 Tax=Spinactinospora alkalitolerans TaxID=687207 RepID=A0A852TWA3_9ACTN|nr:hypothetical protein [Spinactinospora alkalitolerans]NYE47587.1 hypothetical protein [Spinactinospora alkalitolerans]
MRHVPLPDPAEDDAPGPVNFTGRDRITAILTEAGFTDVSAAASGTVMVHGQDAEDAAEFLSGMGPVQQGGRRGAAGARPRFAAVRGPGA